VSMINLPRGSIGSPNLKTPGLMSSNATEIFCKALIERLAGTGLQELAVSGCNLDTNQLKAIVQAVRISRTRRLSVESNNLTDDGLISIAQWIKDGECEGVNLS